MVTNDQVQSIIRSALKVAGAVVATGAIMDPQLGTALQSLIASVGSLATSVGVIWSWYTHKTTAA